jgi:hypothetical protein
VKLAQIEAMVRRLVDDQMPPNYDLPGRDVPGRIVPDVQPMRELINERQ